VTTADLGTGAGAQAPAPVPVGGTQLLDVDEFGGRVERTELPGGLRVLTETMPGVLSATLGSWVGVGSRDEHPDVAGASHFLEHLLFKGTTSRTALEIATAMDAVGGEMNAFTAKEHTCYYANVLASDLPLAVTLLADLVTEACNTSNPSAPWCSRRSPCATTSRRTRCTTCSPRRCSATHRSGGRCWEPSSRSRA
jgi:hypothetical protein